MKNLLILRSYSGSISICLIALFVSFTCTALPIPIGFFKPVSQSSSIYDPDAQAYFNAIAANGGTISTPTKGYVNTFVLASKAHSYWALINRINVFCGDFTACFVPLKAGAGGAIDINSNFVSGDYSESTGLTGDGSTKYIDTGLSANALTSSDTHFAIYQCATVSNFTGAVGAANGGATAAFRFYPPYVNNAFYSDQYSQGDEYGVVLATAAPGLLVAVRRSTTSHELYQNGISIGENTTTLSGSLPALNIFIFACNNNGSAGNFRPDRVGAYSVGPALSDTDAANLNTDLEALQDSLGRGVQ